MKRFKNERPDRRNRVSIKRLIPQKVAIGSFATGENTAVADRSTK